MENILKYEPLCTDSRIDFELFELNFQSDSDPNCTFTPKAMKR